MTTGAAVVVHAAVADGDLHTARAFAGDDASEVEASLADDVAAGFEDEVGSREVIILAHGVEGWLDAPGDVRKVEGPFVFVVGNSQSGAEDELRGAQAADFAESAE